MKKLTECYVYKPTRDEAIEIVERIVANGGECWDAVEGMGVGSSDKYSHDEYECWGYNKRHGSYANNCGSYWEQSARRVNMDEFRELFPLGSDSPSEWNGEGLPPVGTVCEVFNHDLDAAEWEECTIKYMGPFVVVYESKSCIDRSANHSRNVVNFRPLRTKRDKWIERASQVHADSGIAGLYDAGLTKDIEE